MAEPFVERARAKVNLTLRVLGRRPDGYHELESLVVFADVADRLTLKPAAGVDLTVTGPGATDCGPVSDNLVLRAAAALGAAVADLRLGHFELEKHLPAAAGIGGGSADAAAALRLLAACNGLSSDDPRIVSVARATGADVPVCLVSKACVMTGVGETITPLQLPPLPAVLVNPRIAVATKDVFAALGLLPGQLLAGAPDVLESIIWPEPGEDRQTWIEAIASGTNDLEAPALDVEPRIGDVLDALRASDGMRVARMSGSGATCFGIYDNAEQAEAAARQIAARQPAWWVEATILT